MMEDMTMILSYPYFKTDSEYTVPSTVETLYTVYLYDNQYLETLKISEGVKKIRTDSRDDSWYSLPYSVTNVYIPASAETISRDIFQYAYNDVAVHGAVNSYAYEYYNKHLRYLGNYSFEVYYPEELYVTLSTESQAVKSDIYVYGYAMPGAVIKVYDGDKLISDGNSIIADEYSKWEATVPLYKAVDTGSYHDITVVAEKDGETASSKKINVYYEKDAVVFKEFKVVHSGYYSAMVTDETINRIHSMTWIPGSTTNFRVKIINSDRLSAVYLASKVDGVENKIELTRAEDGYW